MKVRVDDARAVTVTIQKPRGFDAARGKTVILGHGAGNDMTSPFLRHFADGLRKAGHAAVRFNFPYREEGKKAPNPRKLLEATYRAVLDAVRKKHAGPIFIGGKSLGSRMATYLAAADEEVAGLVLLGYPLHPAGKPEKIRDDHFPDLRVPALFLSGDRDPLCDLALLRKSLRRYGGEATLVVVEGGEHSFKVLKRSGRTDAEALRGALRALLDWLDSR
jgi:predicted alpha/beta-hydrolase family hydrolase